MLDIKYKIKGVKTEYEIGREFTMLVESSNIYQIVGMKEVNNSQYIVYKSDTSEKTHQDTKIVMDNCFKLGLLKWTEHV